jgi:CelD/BcsL family acetyltransferase involved in cellulose biosynthesis
MRTRFVAVGGWHPLAAVRDGEVVAATVYLRHGDTLYYKFNASDPAALDCRPNDLLLWAGIDLASRLRCTLLDLGASDDDQPGLIRFKRGFGAHEREIRRLVSGPPLPATHEPWRALLSEVTERITAPSVPDELVEVAGDVCYRYFA